MHFTVYVIPPAQTGDEDLAEVMADMLAPYDVECSVTPWRDYPGESALRLMAKHYEIHLPTTIESIYAPAARLVRQGSLAQTLAGQGHTTTITGAHPALRLLLEQAPDWFGVEECGVDEGGLYVMNTYNRDGHWDYWTWAAPEMADVSVVHCQADTPLAYALITPDGHWHQSERVDIDPVLAGEMSRDDYLDQVHESDARWARFQRELLGHHLGARMCVVDCHV